MEVKVHVVHGHGGDLPGMEHPGHAPPAQAQGFLGKVLVPVPEGNALALIHEAFVFLFSGCLFNLALFFLSNFFNYGYNHGLCSRY